MKALLTIKEAAQLLGVSAKTLRRWEKAGKIKSLRTQGGHRRFRREELLQYKNLDLLTVGYARINQRQLPENLDKQVNCLKNYCESSELNYEIIEEVSSNVNSQGIIQLIQLISNRKIEKLILTNKVQLLNLAGNLIFSLCRLFEVEVIILYDSQEEMSKQYLMEDFKDIIPALRHYCNCENTEINGKVLNTVGKITSDNRK
ncbi:hypothetical protein cce_3162 [Crocosphaera subtropica ATCC 51142]|uniref:HTH merR-type domain-containing protein n=1 Tax=Crocosphaera subtropica (strain ATCC 51142 / BH68) TaxID=43989 RepID=B1WXG9_CROS5|nr:helix-turn-helix domain-containing protein [Crocosphaera subtropica]ACB52510.1 hypothetical protein cce_3162 [Crocosphaera subtropica ATCC 51142]